MNFTCAPISVSNAIFRATLDFELTPLFFKVEGVNAETRAKVERRVVSALNMAWNGGKESNKSVKVNLVRAREDLTSISRAEKIFLNFKATNTYVIYV